MRGGLPTQPRIASIRTKTIFIFVNTRTIGDYVCFVALLDVTSAKRHQIKTVMPTAV